MKRIIPVEELCRVPKTQKDRQLTLASGRPRTKAAVFSSTPMARCSPEPTAAIRRAPVKSRSDARTPESSASRDVSPLDFLSPLAPTLNLTAARATSVPAAPVPTINPSLLPVLSVVSPLIRLRCPCFHDQSLLAQGALRGSSLDWVPAASVPTTNPSLLAVLSVVRPLIGFPLPLFPRSIPPCLRCPP